MTFPSPILVPADTPVLKWGIAAPGEIAHTFAGSVIAHGTQHIAAVGSRSLDRATAFANEHSIPTAYGSYDELFADDTIDVVYIANHIDGHLDLSAAALEAGKHVLVEKPLHYSPAKAKDTLAMAKEKGLLMTEAMWSRYLPQASVIRQIIDSAEFGRPERMLATFTEDNRSVDRLWEPGTGGITLDMGIYPIALAHQVFGAPASITATGRVTSKGMDEGSVVTLNYESGQMATLVISGVASHPCVASISGENLSLNLDHPFFVPTTLRLATKDLYQTETVWSDETGVTGHAGLYYQAEWFAHYVSQGLTESPVHTHEEIVSNLEVAIEIYRQLGAHPAG